MVNPRNIAGKAEEEKAGRALLSIHIKNKERRAGVFL